ncbi:MULTISPECIES: response regulator [unclassified Nodularia (in: cyanobacteria)]|uniref:sensor histidine kinase n=1 Tax=unclassified Nodularia (in: cyanobacteria) TaxID=2656917 RepID=UPI00188127F5|nr:MULTISPECIES: response regulator [unclassified Nodularia (in: cyanobacteria)]MBE9201681.1 response regulator [Nodularia sp. LEGE 06071]MCC2691291.1 response regulator [Nodularia sp. LEGE 04288]
MNLVSEQTATILIVDDHPANLGVLSDALDQAGLEVWVAKSGKVALERVQYALPHLILLDVMMPEMDGFETCRRLKANPATQEIPVIFMTALSDTANKVAGFEVGAVDYITKPFQQEEVLSRVKLHLKLYYLSQKLEQKNIQLEQKVAEVSLAHNQLQQMQIKLIQSEKLSSLGQMVAGITHEINNPVNFIYGNLIHAHEYAEELLKLVYLYQQEYPNPSPAIQAELEATDLDFLKNDLIKLFKSMNMGAKRIHEIIKSMRIFSHIDEFNTKAINIHEGIDSTLTILNYRLKAKREHPAIEVVKNYTELPLIECYTGKLNQVFMNILANAIDALEEYDQQRSLEDIKQQPSRIEISTKMIGDGWVAIHIADNGPGMSEAVKSRLFNSFFTTKSMGKGTGLGLSISHQIIVEKHGGSLCCQSTLGEGTEFVIKIPIQQKSSAVASSEFPSPCILEV